MDEIKELYEYVCSICQELGNPNPTQKEVAEYFNSKNTKQEYLDEREDDESYLNWCKDSLDFSIRYE